MSSIKQQAIDLKSKILKRFEFYFDDVNLLRDKFLQHEMQKDHGWVSLDVLFAFNRLNNLTTNKAVIVDVLKDSDIIDISEDNEKIRRNFEEKRTSTVYIKGFPLETTIDSIMEYLKPHGEIKNVIMRKSRKSGVFKGSIFATFKDSESAENFVKNEAGRKFKDVELIRILQNYSWGLQRKVAKKALKNWKRNETLMNNSKDVQSVRFLKGQVMHISGLPTKNLSISSIKNFFNNYGLIAYVVYKPGLSEAWIRFQSTEENAAVKVLERIINAAKENVGGKILFEEQDIQCKILENEAEQKYWADFQNDKSLKQQFLADFTKNLSAKDLRTLKSRGKKRVGRHIMKTNIV